MAYEVTVPRLGWSAEEGTFAGWLKQDGEMVNEGDTLFMLESDKSTQEIESFDGGILRLSPNGLPQTGDVLKVGVIIGYLCAEGEDPPFDSAQASAPAAPVEAAAPVAQTAAPATAPAPAAAVATSSVPTNGARGRQDGRPPISPRALRLATRLDIDWTTIEGSGRTGRIVERDVKAAADSAPATAASHVRATPVARRMAENLGVDLGELAEASPGKKIGKSDVAAAASTTVTDMGTHEESIPISGMRAVIAERMLQSSQSTAPVTLTTEADATELVTLRARLREALAARDKVVPSFNDLFVKLTALALLDHPRLNARWNDSEIVVSKSVHMGVAVDVEGGLLVPVIRDAEKKSVLWIAQETRELAEMAREGRLSPDAMQGGTFTISNLGNFGIDAFTPVINLPQCAILGIGRISKRPAVHDGAVIPRDLVTLSLTFDHRVVDGAPAARFLQTVRESVEQPDAWIAG